MTTDAPGAGRLRLRARLPGLAAASHGLARTLLAGGGGRLGDSAVVSVCVHLLDAARPDEVTIVTNRDAGQVFYGRARPREVAHLDVFHEVADVDHRGVARAMREAVRAWRSECGGHASGATAGGAAAGAATAGDILDFVDLQTGTGGGRASGSLRHGRGLALRLAHRNHVHVAALLPPALWTVYPYLVAAVEEEVARQGVEVRAIARVRFRAAADGAADRDELAPYADANDSLLREPRRSAGPGEPWREADLLPAALAAARALGGAESAASVLARLAAGGRVHELVRGRPWAGDADASRGLDRALLDRWQAEGIVERAGDWYGLSGRGRLLREYLVAHAGEVNLALRVAARHIGMARRNGRRAWQPSGRGPRRRVQPAVANGSREPWSELAVAETVTAAASRRLAPVGGETTVGGAAPGGGAPDAGAAPGGCAPGAGAAPVGCEAPATRAADGRHPGIALADLRVLRRERTRPLDIVLLLDASASMAGARIRAAQELALRLLVRGRDRVAVISFQDREAALRVPLTRNTASVERGVRAVRPFGLTPLAAALETAQAYLAVAHARRPLLLLITDGIPTVSRSPAGPLEDALRAADALGRARVPFTCVGLEPNRGYLAELARRAGGTLYVVDELREAALMEIAEGERRRHRPRARVV